MFSHRKKYWERVVYMILKRLWFSVCRITHASIICYNNNDLKRLRQGNHLVCISLNSRSKTRQRATLLLLNWIYFYRSGGTVNFPLPFMTNVTISIFTSQIFRSWVPIFQPFPPMVSLFWSLYNMSGLAPRMDVLLWGRRDFQISFSNRDT